MVRLTFPERRQVREKRGRLRGLAVERVGADGSGSQSSRRSCGAPGTSGQCQARGLDPAGGRSIYPSPSPLGLWLFSARERSPSPQFFWRVLVGKVMGEGGMENPSTIPWAVGRGQGHHAIDLEKGKGYPSPQFLSCEMEIEEDPLP